MPTSRSAVEDFLYMEARLLDNRQFEEWMDLFTDDALYWVPAGRDDIDPSRHVSIVCGQVLHLPRTRPRACIA